MNFERQAPPRHNLNPTNAELTIMWTDKDQNGNDISAVEVITLDPKWASKIGYAVKNHRGGPVGINFDTRGATDGNGIQITDWHPDHRPA